RMYEQHKENFNHVLKKYRTDMTLRRRVLFLVDSFHTNITKNRVGPVLFHNDIFSLEPKEGEIWPNCSAEIRLVFKPQEARVYKLPVFCDITGHENRLPLLLTGEGLGPQLHFHFEELNIGEIFIRTTHRYEAVLINSGLVEAPFRFVPPTTAMGSYFTFLPQEGIVAPGKFQSIQISFCPTILGEFEEEFCFHVTQSPKPVTLTIRGSVMGPTFHFDVSALHFGDLSFGFPRTLKFCLFNTSLIPMAFNLYIPGDGSGGPSVDSSAVVLKPRRQFWSKEARGLMRPREFTISPCSGTVRPLESQDITVTLCSNTIGDYELELLMDVDDVGKKVLALPLTARCNVPSLRVLNPLLTLEDCWLKLPYERKLILENDSDFPGCYFVLPQEHKEEASAWYSSSMPVGIIEAHSLVEIPFILQAQVLGDWNVSAEIIVFGREESPLEIRSEGDSYGPLVHVYPEKINFGSIRVLEDHFETLKLANQSDIPANFHIERPAKCSCWRIEPIKGVVPANTELAVDVIANLNGTDKFQEKVKVFIEYGQLLMTVVSIQAVGTGTTIVTDKPVIPKLDLKYHFSGTPCSYHFKMTNRGRHISRVCWGTQDCCYFRRSTPALAGTKSKVAAQTPRPGSPLFKPRPMQMELRPGQTVDVVLEGCSNTVQEVRELLRCHAVAGNAIQRMEVDLTCRFICPSVQMSSRLITFRAEKKPSDVLTLQYQPFSLKNTCPLPFSLVLDLEQPFLICSADQQPLPADSKVSLWEELHLCIQFNPAYKKNLHSWVAERVLRIRFKEHRHKEQIRVRGEVHFPNLHLQAKAVDFGCIINDTQQELHMEMTNCSPITAQYHWSFLTDSQVNTIRRTLTRRILASSQQMQRTPWKQSKTFQSHCLFLQTRKKAFDLPACLLSISTLEWEVAPCSASGETETAHGVIKKRDVREQKTSCSLQPLVLVFQVLSSTPVESQSPVRMRGLSQFSDMEHPNVGMQEVFDVLPLWGVLQPGESQLVTFTFFGHANIVARVTALCHVEGGPTYKVVLTGEASCPSYQLDVEEIDWGPQVFNKVLKAKVTLRNTGVLEFTYVVPNSGAGTAANPLPGVPVVLPATGSIAPGEKQALKVYYLPGKLGVFCRTFQVQVAYLEPAEIFLKGEGIFPRVTKNVPRML
ncbi:HYDIN protein, partial [Irena cyanogastra]|nr:HYDIN protein [Irena cyanogastra]